MEAITTIQGRIVIPASIRRKFGIKVGTRIQVDVDEKTQRIILTPITRTYVHSLRGKYRGKGLLKKLMSEKKCARSL